MKKKEIKKVINNHKELQLQSKKKIEASKKKKSSAPKKLPFLFFLQGSHATAQKGLLTIHGIEKSINWFTAALSSGDKKVRNAGCLEIESFTALFAPGRSFNKIPPNAFLTATPCESRKSAKMALILKSATYSPREEKLFFKIKRLKGSPFIEGHFDLPSLFIDDSYRLYDSSSSATQHTYKFSSLSGAMKKATSLNAVTGMLEIENMQDHSKHHWRPLSTGHPSASEGYLT